MAIKKVKLVYFSPTGTGKKTINAISEGIGYQKDSIDLTLPKSTQMSYHLAKNELTIIAIPVYSGRVPQTAIDRLNNIRGNETPAVLVAIYGNRAFEDALLELHHKMSEQGFITIAGAAFIGQHSYDTAESPIATGRPDSEDLKKANDFGVKIKEIIERPDKASIPNIPGNYPYRERRSRDPRSPETDEARCILCGTCANVCPTDAIKVVDLVETKKEVCIYCTACVQNCPTGARHWEHDRILSTAKWLSTEHGDRKEPEIFL